MSLIETAPQKSTKYNGRKQDHGDAAEQQGHFRDSYWDKKMDHSGINKREAEHLKLAMAEIEDFTSFTPAQLEAAANSLLGESPQEAESFTTQSPDDEYLGYFDEYSEDELDAIEEKDRFYTEAELGLKSKHEIRKHLARSATIDVEFDGDDTGDSTYNIPVRIKNRL